MPEHGGVVTMERHHTGSGASRADRHRARSRLVWLLAALTSAPLILGIVGSAAYGEDPLADPAPLILLAGLIGGSSVVGALLATRVPGNAIGPWLLAAGSLTSLEVVAAIYSTVGTQVVSTPWPATSWAALFESVLFLYPIVIVLVVVPLIFPTGNLLSPRWRIVPAFAIVTLITNAIGTTFSSEPVGAIDAQSPLAADAFGGVLDALQAAGSIAAVAAILGAAVSLVVRWRRAGQVERAQLKWLIAVASVGAGAISASILVSGGPLGDALFALFLAACIALPFAIGIAVLRYRLFDIDHIISRTIGYAVVTGILGAAFVGTILVAGTVLASFTQNQTIAVAASTLVAFALFQPVRGRVQAAVDRRFDRARVDGERTAAAFSERLRHDVEISTVADELLSTIDATIKPAARSLWLREGR